MALTENGVKDDEKKKIINDPIHGLMEFEDWAVKFIDTEQFQRLRSIKQLGSAYYVYPGASHNRFEHSLGVAHLAYTLIKKLSQDDKHIKCVTLAALCHDLGHGPFSHLFEKDYVPQLRKSKPEIKEFRHETKSIEIFQRIINKLEKDNDEIIADLDTNLIKALIVGKKKAKKKEFNRFISYDDRWPGYLFEIVANEENGIDVDKFDYIARDCHYLGIKTSSDFSRLMNYSRKTGDQPNDRLAYYVKERYNIYELFHTRYSLYKRAYNHVVCKAIDFMICDALIKADNVFKISHSINDLDKYLKLDDTILNQIEYSSDPDPDLKESKRIIKRIRTRDLYKLVCEFSIPSDKERFAKFAKKKITEENITINNKELEKDVIVETPKLDYGKGENDPVKSVKFYDKNKILDENEIPDASYLIPKKYEEFIFRVYTRSPEKIDEIKKEFQILIERVKKEFKKKEENIAKRFCYFSCYV